MLEGLEIRGAELKDLRGILEIKNDVIEGSTSDYIATSLNEYKNTDIAPISNACAPSHKR